MFSGRAVVERVGDDIGFREELKDGSKKRGEGIKSGARESPVEREDHRESPENIAEPASLEDQNTSAGFQ